MELDRRKVGISELDKNIPQGRGMIKSQRLATTPEFYQRINQMIEDQAKYDPPSFHNDLIVEMEQQLRRSLGKNVILRYWNDGFEMPLECKVEYIDSRTGVVIASKGIELIHVKLKCL
ncbi:YolD-like family protein [Salinicoccus roseus]|uniref:YolD-like family protein n=1 Tax=Salinicoccus roseus TaxID=45670 RepID=UPI002301424B|nr:YolD-like family protein [Salinicoccus roseus]